MHLLHRPFLTLTLALTLTAATLPNLSRRSAMDLSLPSRLGTCTLAMEEYQTCASDLDDLWTIITLYDGREERNRADDQR